ncbi:MAG TPA: sugar ABC transporter ATP-binding protein [Methylomirabilota bacterium]|nr:sugar ABC transporter ATP-binding protein [Methylomirabilota bacterium]
MSVLEIRGAVKRFPGVTALDHVDLRIDRNEVVGLIGENGAGKSTLLKVLSGVYDLDEGSVLVNDRAVRFQGPREAFDHGLAMVFQEQSVLPTLSVAENIFLGREVEFLRFGFIDKRRMNAAARELLRKVHLDIDPATSASTLSFAERQMVEIAKALSLDSRIDGEIVVLLDEPTSVLESREIELLFAIIRELKSRAAFVFISHRLDEVLEISDRIYVMRDGKVVHEAAAAEAPIHELHEKMVGRAVHREYYRENKQHEPAATVLLSAHNLGRTGHFEGVSFELREGEILGIAGVIGSGREALARCLAGLEPADSGSVSVGGAPARLSSPWTAVARGIGYIPQERKVEGIVLASSVAENMTMAALSAFAPRGLIDRRRERDTANAWIERLRIKTPSADTPIGKLSGGNQQKVVLAKWRIAGARVLILDHPTRGVDVGAKEDVYDLIREMSDDGLGIVLLGDTLDEVVGLSHRILVMKDGGVAARFDAPPGGKPNQVSLITHMV